MILNKICLKILFIFGGYLKHLVWCRKCYNMTVGVAQMCVYVLKILVHLEGLNFSLCYDFFFPFGFLVFNIWYLKIIYFHILFIFWMENQPILYFASMKKIWYTWFSVSFLELSPLFLFSNNHSSKLSSFLFLNLCSFQPLCTPSLTYFMPNLSLLTTFQRLI